MQNYSTVDISRADVVTNFVLLLVPGSFERAGILLPNVCVCLYRQTTGVMQGDADLGVIIFCLNSLYIKIWYKYWYC